MATNGRVSDEELARQALRDVLATKKAGTRVKTSAALTLLRATGSVRARDDRQVDRDGEAPDPMRDLDLAEQARQRLKLRGKHKAWREWTAAWLRWEEGIVSLDELEGLLNTLDRR